jgi:hypothetical protein
MCYTKREPSSVWQCLGVDVEEAMFNLCKDVTDELCAVSGGFYSHKGTHKRKAGKIYGTLDLPHFKIKDAQRDVEKRLQKLGVTAKDISDRNILDIGSNVGALLFALERYKPKSCAGLEYLANQVQVANKIATIENFKNIEFMAVNLDDLDADHIQDGDVDLLAARADTTFCLSVNKHVKDEDNLYKLLGKLTKETLFFEGNAGTDKDEVIKKLGEVGFTTVEYLGFCDDDVRPANNNRPLFRASKK